MLVALGASPTAALAGDTLVALSDCPSVGPNRACLPVEFRLGEGGTAKKAGATVDSTEKLTKLYFIKGRLSGGSVRSYNLAIIYDRRDSEAATDGPDFLAYRGRTRSDRPVVLTDHGPLEITSKNFDAAPLPNLLLVDEKRLSVVARYLVYEAYPTHVVDGPSGLSAWIEKDGLCISATESKQGFLTLSDQACDGLNALGSTNVPEEIRPDFERLLKLPELRWFRPEDISEDGRFLENSGFSARAYRVRSSGQVLIYTWCNDCS